MTHKDAGQAGSGEQVQLPLNCGEHDGYWYIFTADEKHFSVCDREIDARFLVEACNSHASLSAENATLREQRDAMRLALEPHAKWLRQCASEIRAERHAGWGNTCEQAADAIAATLSLYRKGP